MATALITGASSGIGLELARIHASKQGTCIIVARSEEKLMELKKEIESTYNTAVIVYSCDLSKEEQVESLINMIHKEGHQVDYLINNAGFGDYGLFHETEWSKEKMMIDLNVKTLTHLTKAFLPGMVERGSGKIMNVASTAAFQPGPYMAVYFATKNYVLSFSEGIARELKGTGVTVTALCPGPTESNFQKNAEMEDSKMVKSMKMPSSRQVAEYGYKAMLKGKTVAIEGFLNYIMANSPRLMPRNWVTKVAMNVMARVKK